MKYTALSAIVRASCLVVAGVTYFAWPLGAEPQPSPVFAELFTSQGCSSCPAADLHWGELQKRSDVVAISFNIDYWDYIGWRDTLASHDNTVRQQAYEKSMPSRQVYTPQVIVDGIRDVVGNQRRDVNSVLDARVAETRGKRVPISLEQSGNSVQVRIGVGTAPQGCLVWVAHTVTSRSVNVTRGENSGRLMTYWNVVRDFSVEGKWSGEAVTFNVPSHGPDPNEITDGLAVWIQSGSNGPVYGAAQVRLRNNK